MFETVAPPETKDRGRSTLYQALTFSLSLHAGAGLFALGENMWEVTFPAQSPAIAIAFIVEAPAPPPPPPPPPAPRKAEPETIRPAEKKIADAFVAPAVIPDTIPIVEPEALTPVALAVPNGVIGGVEGGVETGVVGGTIGGVDRGVVGSVAPVPEDGRVHISRDEKLPLISVSQDYPSYPETAQKHGWEDELVVRYVVGKDGRVREVTVIQPPTRDVFVKGTLEAIRSWRFRPLVKDGHRQEVVHELTIYFRLNASAT